MDKKISILVLCLVFVSQVLFAETATMTTKNNDKLAVLDLLREIKSLYENLRGKLDTNQKLSKEAKQTGELDKSKAIILEELSLISQVKEQLTKLPVPSDCEQYKALSIKYYESLTAVTKGKLTGLETALDGTDKPEETWTAVEQLLEWSNKCLAEKKRIMLKYNINAL